MIHCNKGEVIHIIIFNILRPVALRPFESFRKFVFDLIVVSLGEVKPHTIEKLNNETPLHSKGHDDPARIGLL